MGRPVPTSGARPGPIWSCPSSPPRRPASRPVPSRHSEAGAWCRASFHYQRAWPPPTPVAAAVSSPPASAAVAAAAAAAATEAAAAAAAAAAVRKGHRRRLIRPCRSVTLTRTRTITLTITLTRTRTITLTLALALTLTWSGRAGATTHRPALRPAVARSAAQRHGGARRHRRAATATHAGARRRG